jgi:alpha-glucosidase
LRDNLPANEDDPERVREIGQRAEYNMNRPEVHEIFRRWRKLCDEYDPHRILVGETFVMDLEKMASYYGNGQDELNLAFNFPFALADFDAAQLAEIVRASNSLIPPEAWPVWMASNHDVGRFTTRWCDGDERKIRCVLVMLLTLRGTPFLYYGDEIGMPERPVTGAQIRDPVGLRESTRRQGRDPCRTPMQWSSAGGGGFTSGSASAWLPLGDVRACNVADQKEDPSSTLNFCRDLIAFRKGAPELRRAVLEPFASGPAPWAWKRGDRYLVAINMSEESCRLDDVEGRVAVSTRRDERDVSSALELSPWEAVIVDRSAKD